MLKVLPQGKQAGQGCPLLVVPAALGMHLKKEVTKRVKVQAQKRKRELYPLS